MERGRVFSRRDLDDKGFGQNKVLRSSFRSRTVSEQTAIAGFLVLTVPEKQISGYPPASGS